MKREKIFEHIVANVVIVVVLFMLYLGSFDAPMAVITSGTNLKPIYKGNTAEKRVSLMINVYWGTEFITEMLDMLDKYNAKCTFFVGGMWAGKNMDILAEIDARGHEIGNHGYLHKDHKILNEQSNKDEIVLTHKLVEKIINKKMNLFAPPSGSFGSTMMSVAEKEGYKVILWSKDTIDWRDHDYKLVYKRATSDVGNGDLILMHPTEHTKKALPEVLEYYKAQGLRAVTVSENLANTII